MVDLLAGSIALVVLAPHDVVEKLVRDHREEARRRRPESGWGWLLPVSGTDTAALDQEVPHRLVAGATTVLLYRFGPERHDYAWNTAARLPSAYDGVEVLVDGEDLGNGRRALVHVTATGDRDLLVPAGPLVVLAVDGRDRVVGEVRTHPSEIRPVVTYLVPLEQGDAAGRASAGLGRRHAHRGPVISVRAARDALS